MVDRSRAIDSVVSLMGGTISILGLQMILVLPIYLIDTAFLDYGIWPGMTLRKGLAVLVLGTVLTVGGGEIYDNVENPFDEQIGVGNPSDE